MKILLFAMIFASFYFLLKGTLRYDLGFKSKLVKTMISEPDYNDLTENSICSIYYSSYKYPF
mgnify:CR=1 FL=1